jgi:hypothetical protein
MIGPCSSLRTLSWLVDAASETPVADGLQLAGGALTLAVPHPLIARRTWLWRAESGEVIEALGFVAGGFVAGEFVAGGFVAGGLATRRGGEPARRCRPRPRGRRRVEAGRAFARLDRVASVHAR